MSWELYKTRKKNSSKYLGMEIDKNWTFKSHILEVMKKIRQLLPKMYQLRNILNLKNRKIVYEAWIGSILRYGIEQYGFASEYLIERIQKLQNKLIKVMFGHGKKKKTSILYKEKKILKIIELRDYIITTKNYYQTKYKISTNYRDNLRKNKRRYVIPNWNNKYGKRIKIWYIPTIFNKLPDNMLNCANLKDFKKKMKEKLINEQS
jgi:hypothetical protein